MRHWSAVSSVLCLQATRYIFTKSSFHAPQLTLRKVGCVIPYPERGVGRAEVVDCNDDGAAVLGLLAVFVARSALGGPSNVKTAPVTIAAVVAAKPLAFGDKIAANSLKLVDLPPEVLQGAFKTVELAVGDGSRVSQRGIAVNEVLVPTAISGTGNRLSTMGVIGGSMRAVTVDVTSRRASAVSSRRAIMLTFISPARRPRRSRASMWSCRPLPA